MRHLSQPKLTSGIGKSLGPFAYALLLSLLSALAGAAPLLPAAPELAATAWLLVDSETGTVLAEHEADLPLPPASLAKMLTSYIVSEEIEAGRLSEQELVRISDNAWERGGAKTDGSTMFLEPRSKVSVIDLMRGVIIQSGNDAAIALAEHISGSEEQFADLMNQQAAQLGMHDSLFHNATGLPSPGMVSTARDLAVLARATIVDHPDHYGIYAEKYFTHNNIRQPNRNRLLWRDSSVDGLKTGHTEASGYCLVASAQRRDMRLIAVVLGTDSDQARARETQKLLSYGFRNYESKRLYDSGAALKQQVRVWYGRTESVDLVVEEPVLLTFLRGSEKQLEAQVVVPTQLEAPIQAGQKLGSLRITLHGELLLERDLVADRKIEQGSLFKRFKDWLTLFFSRLFS